MINTPHAYAFRLECCDHRLNPQPTAVVQLIGNGYMKEKFLTVEAVLCGAPCIALAIGGLPIILVAAFRTLSSNTGEALKVFLFVFGLIFSLFQYGVLSLRTIKQKKYRFGFMFWIAVVSASIGIWWIGVSFGLRAVAMVIGPILVATLHFMTLQLRSRKHSVTAT